MTKIDWIYADGFSGKHGYSDCVTRAIAIATGTPYNEVWQFITDLKCVRGKRSADYGVSTGTVHVAIKHFAPNSVYYNLYHKRPTLKVENLPPQAMCIVDIRGHMFAYSCGMAFDTWDCVSSGRRKILGYWTID